MFSFHHLAFSYQSLHSQIIRREKSEYSLLSEYQNFISSSSLFLLLQIQRFSLYSCVRVLYHMVAFKNQKIQPPSHSQTLDISRTEIDTWKSHKKTWYLSLILGVISVCFVVVFWTMLFQNLTNIAVLRQGNGNATQPEYVAPRSLKQVNVLLAGIGGKNHQGWTLTDTIMLASLDDDRKTITLLSIPRDLFVSYPTGWAGKINAIYSIWNTQSGIENLKTKVTEITGESIDHFLVIDFDWFIQTVDTLGGIEVDVPEDLTDRQYPNWNYGYETFSIAQWLQILDGATALKYVRSRHSTSDYARSERQQLVIQAIKERVLSLWYLTDPKKIGDTVTAIASHIHTDLSITDMANLALHVKDIGKDRMYSFNLGIDTCVNVKLCEAWWYLYNPNRELFWGASVLLPENATLSRVSYYDDTRRFASIIFRYGEISKDVWVIHIINQSKGNLAGFSTAVWLKKMGFPLAQTGTILNSTWVSDQSRIHVYWDPTTQVWIDPDGPLISALQKAIPNIPITIEPDNLFVFENGPKVEIILWRNYRDVISFARSPTYITESREQKKQKSTQNRSVEESGSGLPLVVPPLHTSSTEDVQEKTFASTGVSLSVKPDTDESEKALPNETAVLPSSREISDPVSPTDLSIRSVQEVAPNSLSVQ